MSNLWFRALARYEYAMRVDEDVCVQRFVTNPFALMHEHSLVYGFGVQTEERHPETLETMPEWVTSYATALKLKPPAEPVKHIYFTNFFVSRVDFWFGANVQGFLHAVSNGGGIYLHRWGDAPIQTTALQLFAPSDAVARLPTDYLHLSTMNRVFSDGHETDGWVDAEMLRHPIARAYARRLVSAGGANQSNCSGYGVNGSNTSLGCDDAGVRSLTGKYVSISFETSGVWSGFDASRLASLAAVYASYFSVDVSDIVVQRQWGGSGITISTRVMMLFD
jgi:hypothetical protein